MSPEQTFDARNCDARSDIYALGCTLHWLLTGQPVYPAENRLKKFLAHANAPIPQLSDVLPGLPRQFDAVFAKMLAKRPEGRYPTMQAVAADLAPCLEIRQRPGAATVNAVSPAAAIPVAATENTAVLADATRVAGSPQAELDLAKLPAEAQPVIRRLPKGYCDVEM
jgi:serine/threonine-protein kinase